MKYLNTVSLEEFGVTIEAFTYPPEFGVCDGSAAPISGVALGQQSRKTFGLAYRTVYGNDAQGNDYGYKLHLIYGCLAAPSEKAYATINDSPEAITFSWEVTTTPVAVTGYRAVSSITIDSTLVDPTKLALLETILYGVSPAVEGRLPLPAEVISTLEEAAPSALSFTSSPLDDATGVAVTANIVLTFNNAVAHESVVVASAAGVLKTVTRAWDSENKVLTLDPATNLAGSTTYIVTVAGVSDIYGQELDAAAFNFATV